MSKGIEYPIYNEIRLYADADRALAYGSNHASYLRPNTDSDSGSYQAYSTGEGHKGNAYVATNWGGMDNPWYPAIPIWWIPYHGGGGYFIGWTNNSKNLGASVPTLSVSSVNMGTQITIYTNYKNTSFTHSLYWRRGSGSRKSIATGVKDKRNWTPARNTFLPEFPSNTSGSIAIICETYNGSTLIGTREVNLTLKVPSDVVPSITSISAAEANMTLINLGVTSFVRNISKIKATASGVTAGQGATIKSYSWWLGNRQSSATSPTFEPVDYLKPAFQLTVTDSRGRTFTKDTPGGLTHIAYSPPNITEFSAKRDQYNKVKVTIALKATRTTLGNKNTLQYRVHSRLDGATSWSQRKVWTNVSGDINLSATAINDIPDNGKHILRVTVKDSVGNEVTRTHELEFFTKEWLEVIDGELVNIMADLQVEGKDVLTTASSLAASQIGSGTFGTARIPNLAASKITSGVFNIDRIPDLIKPNTFGTTPSSASDDWYYLPAGLYRVNNNASGYPQNYLAILHFGMGAGPGYLTYQVAIGLNGRMYTRGFNENSNSSKRWYEMPTGTIV